MLSVLSFMYIFFSDFILSSIVCFFFHPYVVLSESFLRQLMLQNIHQLFHAVFFSCLCQLFHAFAHDHCHISQSA